MSIEQGLTSHKSQLRCDQMWVWGGASACLSVSDQLHNTINTSDSVVLGRHHKSTLSQII